MNKRLFEATGELVLIRSFLLSRPMLLIHFTPEMQCSRVYKSHVIRDVAFPCSSV